MPGTQGVVFPPNGCQLKGVFGPDLIHWICVYLSIMADFMYNEYNDLKLCNELPYETLFLNVLKFDARIHPGLEHTCLSS